MKPIILALSAALAGTAPLHAQTAPEAPFTSGSSGDLQKKVSPGFAGYTDNVLFGEVWPGDGLSARDRSLAVISVLIATNKPDQLRGHLRRALINGVTPVEASGVLAHQGIYTGWPNAVSALTVFDEVYTAENVDFSLLQQEMPTLPASTSDTEAAAKITEDYAEIAPRFADLGARIVFDDLWTRSDLSPRDRSLVTIASLTATGDMDLLPDYLRRGLDAGMTPNEIAEMLTHIGFYAGWSKSMRAMDVFRDTLDS